MAEAIRIRTPGTVECVVRLTSDDLVSEGLLVVGDGTDAVPPDVSLDDRGTV